MFINKNKKNSKLFRGVVVGAAGILCLGFTPVQAFNAVADLLSDDDTGIGSEAIVVEGASNSVVRGSDYVIKDAYFGSNSKIELGNEDYSSYEGQTAYGSVTIEKITSDIKVLYSTGEEVAITPSSETGEYGKFTAANVGDYTVKYGITVQYSNGESKTYETQIAVQSTTSSAYMKFASDSVVMPKIYDKKLAKSGSTYKDIELAIPTVYSDAEQEVKETIDEVLLPSDPSGIAGKNTVKITVSKTSGKQITLDEDEGKFYIRGSEIAEKTSDSDNIVVRYSYYVGTEFVTSVEKTITVYDDYYADINGNSTYKLTTSRSEDLSAITNVAATLPTIKAYSSEESKEEVSVKVEAVAYKKDKDGNYKETKNGSIVDGKFTPWADGDYKIVFTVTDFYGNTATNTLLVSGVVDSQKPVVYMYDASDKVNNNREEGKFVSAENKFKSKAAQNNIIIYAIGATDNVNSADEMEYKRTIKSSTRTIEISGYSKYNLIFDYNFEALVKADNPSDVRLYNQMKNAGVDTTKEADVKAWLNSNGYLFVTNQKSEANTEADYVSKGLAYVDVNYGGDMLVGSLSGISYTVSYIATDKASTPNTSETLPFTVSVTNKTDGIDTNAPSIEAIASLKSYYGTKDIVKFTLPAISDEEDKYLDKSVYYQYLDSANNALSYENAEKQNVDVFNFEDENYEINIAEDIKLLATSPAKIKITIVATDDYGNETTKTKTVDIIDVQDTLTPTIIRENYISPSTGILQNETVSLPRIVYYDDNVGFISSDVKVYHIDANGNKIAISNNGKKENPDVNSDGNQTYTLDAGSFIASYSGKYEAVVTIRDYVGNYVVTYYYYDVDATNVVSGSAISTTMERTQSLEAGEVLDLPVPTVSYSIGDDYSIYGVSKDDSKSATNYRVLLKNTANPNEYNLDQTTFVGYNTDKNGYTYELQYEVDIHVIKKGYGFELTERNGVKFTNAEDSKVYSVYKLTDEENHDGDYVLVNRTTGMIGNIIYGAINGTAITFYDLSTALTTNAKGHAYLENAGVKYYPEINENNKLVFVSNGGNYADHLTIDVEGAELVISGNGALAGVSKRVSLTKTVQIKHEDSSALLTTNDYVVATLTSDIYSVTVADTIAPVGDGVINYNYPEIDKGDTISVQPIKNTDESNFMASGIDEEKSYVEVAFSGRTSSGSETSSSYKFYMNKWASKEDAKYYYNEYDSVSGNILYETSSTNNGTYTISYHVFDKAGNETVQTYKLAVGDTKSPTLKLGKDMIKDSYKVGDTLTIDMAAITIGDDITKDTNILMKNTTIKVTNTSTNEVLENIEDGIVLNEATNKYEGFFSYKIEAVGTYKIEVTVKDEAGWPKTQTLEFEVTEKAAEGNVVSTVVGIVLIVVAVVVLAGVITYFVVSKVKLDKELKKGKNNNKKA